VVVYDTLPSRSLVLVKQELVTKPWGPEKYGW
jgi:bifunctional UDP-N-acetylglucosamine pyrophosphorylase/glucosamine-1-phosphate N-acetyltransferase